MSRNSGMESARTLEPLPMTPVKNQSREPREIKRTQRTLGETSNVTLLLVLRKTQARTHKKQKQKANC